MHGNLLVNKIVMDFGGVWVTFREQKKIKSRISELVLLLRLLPFSCVACDQPFSSLETLFCLFCF